MTELLCVYEPAGLTAEELARNAADDDAFLAAHDVAGGLVPVDESLTAAPDPYVRDRHGQFAKRAGSSSLVRGVDLTHEDWDAVAAGLPKPALVFGESDAVVEAIAARQGFDGKPATAGKADVDALIEAGGVELFRGTNASYADQFVDGPYFVGHGAFGNGIYTSTDRGVAERYAAGHTGHNAIQVMRLALSPQARIVSYQDLHREMNARDDLPEALDDEGRYAAAAGYDGYHRSRSDGSVHYVIVNRTALTVEVADEQPGGLIPQTDTSTVDVSGMNGGGWTPDDPELAEIRAVAARYGFTAMASYPTGAAAWDWNRPNTLLVGPKSKWTPDGYAAERARAGGRYYMPGTEHLSPAEYYIGHEAGHRHHAGNPYQAVAEDLAAFAARNGVKKVDRFGSGGRGAGSLVDIKASDFDRYGDPEAFLALMPYGLSRYGASNIDELVAELHTAWVHGQRSELIDTVAAAEGWR